MSVITPKLPLAAPAFIPLGPVKEVSHLNALPGTDTEGDVDASDSENEENTTKKQKRKKNKEKRFSEASQGSYKRGSVSSEINDKSDSRRGSFAGYNTERSGYNAGSRRSSLAGYKTDRGSYNADSRISSVTGFYSERGGTKSKLGRRNSMLESIKDELSQIVSIPALRKFRRTVSNEDGLDDNVFTKVNEIPPQRRRSLYIGRRRTSSCCSDLSDVPIVTDYEMRKIKMLQTLDAMGMQMPKKNTVYQDNSDEIRILESMALRKRQSLNTRLLEGTRITRLSRPHYRRTSQTVIKSRSPSLNRKSRRNSRRTSSSDRSSQPTPDYTSDKDISKDHMDSMQKVIGMMKTPGSDDSKPNLRTRASISGADLASHSIGIFRRKLQRKKGKFSNKFVKLAKFLVILLRAWRIHSKNVNEILGQYDSIDALAKFESTEKLMFDVSDFKASKEAQISKKVRELLEKPPKERTSDDIHYLQIALRNYNSIVEYPVRMQRLISEKCWYETYDAKRVIVREGRIPMCFYFILSGSAVVTAFDPETSRTKTVMFLNRGDSFGEQAIMTRSLRQTTVITREKIELLVMSDSDFVDVFMSGGLRDPEDPFLRSLDILDGWPIETLADHPSSAIFSFFKRGTILVHDSQNNDWIFVIKSGSCSLLKKLKDVSYNKPKSKPKKKKHWKEELEDMANNVGGNLNHEEQIQLLHHQEIRRLEEENLTLRYYALPEINIATNAAYAELRQMHTAFLNQNTLTRALGNLQDIDMEDVGSVTGSVLTEIIGDTTAHHRKMSLVDLGELVAKGPLLSKSELIHQLGSEKERHHADSHDNDDDRTTSYGGGGQIQVTIKPPSASTINQLKSAAYKTEKETRFVNVRTLTKGQHFGLEDVLFKEQGSFSLVSNGVEVIMINKKLYLEHLDHNRRIRLNDKVYPYPSDDELQNNLDDYMYWEFHKKQTFENALRDHKILKIKPHDCRAILEVPPAI